MKKMMTRSAAHALGSRTAGVHNEGDRAGRMDLSDCKLVRHRRCPVDNVGAAMRNLIDGPY